MTLPKLNDTPKYELEIPSTGSVISYRPYLVKEEKILLMAFESQDQKQAMRAMVDTVVACVYEDINPQSLTTFDVEYMFLQIRSKSVGETSTIGVKCSECEHQNEVVVPVGDIKIPKSDVSKLIELTPEISIEMTYPKFNEVVDGYEEGKQESKFAFELIEKSIGAIITPDERINTNEVKSVEVKEFVESMTTAQLSMVSDFVEQMPALKHDIEFNCSNCSSDNKQELRGVADFF
jgi:DNA-directed RNA polymerase subunit M/transcription elongation factor TFIIS